MDKEQMRGQLEKHFTHPDCSRCSSLVHEGVDRLCGLAFDLWLTLRVVDIVTGEQFDVRYLERYGEHPCFGELRELVLGKR